LRVIKNKNIQFEDFFNYLPILNGQFKKNGQLRIINKDVFPMTANVSVLPNYLDLTESSDMDQLIQATSTFLNKYLGNSELGLFIFNEDNRTYCNVNQISEELNTFVSSVHKNALIDWLIETGKPKIIPDPISAKINGSSTQYLLYHSREDIKKKLIVLQLDQNLSYNKINHHIDILEHIFRLFFLKSDKMILETEIKQVYKELHVFQSKLSNDFKLSAIGELTSGIVEEILTPLQIIMSNVEFLNSEVSHYPYILNIKNQVKNVENLVNRVLKFANIEDSKVRLNSVNINDILITYHKMISSSLQSEKLECILNLDNNIPSILSNPIYINQILSNIFSLIRNSDKKKGGGILIQTKYLDEKVQLRVILTKKLNDPETDDGIRQEFKLLKNLMTRHEGKISLENLKSSGSTLILSFPLKRKIR
jgi:signal transduction histidine kinase